jgi:hypothetical protein
MAKLHLIARRLGRVAAALLALQATGCSCDRRGALSTPQAGYEDDGARINKPLGLITPEQFAGNVASALGYDDPEALDAILRDKAVALGGVDFRAAQRRSRTPTGQAQLTIRRLAWDIARAVVDRDVLRRTQNEPARTFLLANITVDRPELDDDRHLPPEAQIAVKDSNRRYHAQIEDLYWRLLSRAPKDEERAIMNDLFLAVLKQESSTIAAWKAVLYALLASMEYWNI